MEPMKAWYTELSGVHSVVFADTRGKAIAKTIASAADAWGRDNAKWTDCRAVRAKHHDGANVGNHILSTWACHPEETVIKNKSV